MSTAQIIIFLILAILIVFCYFKIANNLVKDIEDGFLYLLLSEFLVFSLYLIAIVATNEVNELKTQIKSKCPEYEKVENVYKLK